MAASFGGGSDRGLSAALRALDGFGVDLQTLPSDQRLALVAAVRQALGAASGTARLPEGSRLDLDTASSEAGRRIRLHLATPTVELRLEAEIGANGEASYALELESTEGFRVEGRRALTLDVVQVEQGVLLVPRGLEDGGVPRFGAQPEPTSGPTSEPVAAESRASPEGFGAFVEGAVLGDFGGSDSWSALAGQTAIGFVPVAGQIADVRDLLAALDGLGEGQPGAPLAVGAAVLGFVPGLDFLKAGSRVGRRALREAGENLGEVAESGLKTAQAKMSAEGAARAAKELRVIEVGRLELGARLRATFDGFEALGLPRGAVADQLRSDLDSAINAVAKSGKPDDIVGALRDVLGVPVPKSPDRMYDHLKEVSNMRESLDNVAKSLERAAKKIKKRGADPSGLYRLRSAVFELRKRVDALMKLR